MIGQAFAIKHGAAPQIDDALRHDAGDAARRAGDLGAARRRGEGGERPRRSPTARWSAGSPTPSKAAIPAAGSKSATPSSAPRAQGFLGCAAAIQNFDFLAALPKLQVPTLVLCGADDQGTPPAGNKRIAELVPGGRYEEIADARHLPNVERPDAFNRILLGWLEAQRRA